MNENAAPARPEIALRDWEDLQALDAKINALLPPQYQNCYDAVKPVSMGSAELVYGPDGKVAWDQIWTSFCDLALAGGPPHRGSLLEPANPEETFAERDGYDAVVAEISRGLWLVTELPVLPHAQPGWIGVRCDSVRMASWLARAIVVENVWARARQNFLYLPAGPNYRLAREIKNVITALAKTFHYWTFHMPANSRSTGGADDTVGDANDLLEPALPWEAHSEPEAYASVARGLAKGIRDGTGLPTLDNAYHAWVGVQCTDDAMAIWLMRALVVDDVMVRTEKDILYLPANATYLESDRVPWLVARLARALHLWRIHALVSRR